MRKPLLCAGAVVCSLFTYVNPLLAQGTAFTYQGLLVSNTAPVSGSFDLQFTVFDAATNGNPVGGPLTNAATAISNGVFLAPVDFGPGVFTGAARWLEIGVRPGGQPGPFALLTPLQPLTATPYAILSSNAIVAASAGAVAASNITGTVAVSQLPSNLLTNNAGGVTLGGTFSGNGNGLTGLNASQLTAGSVPLAQLPAAVVTNNAAGVTLSGNFSGNGAGLSGVTAGAVAAGISIVNPAITGATINNSTFAGNGGGLTNLSSGALAQSVIILQTNVYASAGTYNITVPALASSMVVKLWGAGGGDGGDLAVGGGGAFVTVTLNVSPGQVYTVVTGQAGGGASSGGQGSNDGEGGNANSNSTGHGGQASSLFQYTGSNYIMEAVAGGGGGGGYDYVAAGGAGGNPGQNGQTAFGNGGSGGYNGAGGGATAPAGGGAAYANNAASTGESALNLMGGKGGAPGNQTYPGAGGGGGYGGGGGGVGSGGGGGGGSYGTQIIGGSYNTPGNTNDPNYIPNAGMGGTASYGGGNDGLVVVIFSYQTATLGGNLTLAGGTIVATNPIFAGVVNLDGAISNVLQFAQVGVAPPADNSAGWKVRTWTPDYGIGVSSGAQWYSSQGQHQWWYGNAGVYSNLMTLDAGGDLTLNGNLAIGGNLSLGGAAGTFYTSSGFYFNDRAGTNTYGYWALYADAGKAYLWNNLNGNRISVDTSGNFRAQGTITPNASPDIAETIPTADNVEAGDIVCADPRYPESVIRCGKSDHGLLGVISDGTGGFLINARASSVDAPLTGKPLVLAGRVPVKVCLENGPIQIGDTLAPSSTPGTAMRAAGAGPTVGIALENFTAQNLQAGGGAGKVLCFVKASEANVTELQEKAAQVDALEERVNELERTIQKLTQGTAR